MKRPKRKAIKKTETAQQKPQTEQLFQIPEDPHPEPALPPLREPIWTENKAKLIERYIFYFLMVTKHGTYIDGFAGPQEPEKPHMWAAKLVLEIEPRWLRNFYLFENDAEQITRLRELKDVQPHDPKRIIEVIGGDVNEQLTRVLAAKPIKQSEACFCLLDQRTFECQWETIVQLSRYKSSGNKIELFYFLPNHWFNRALSALRDKTPVKLWWGRDDWEKLYALDAVQRKDLIVRRIREELGYHSVKPWPIHEKKEGGAVMYYMIHATDHAMAPGLMARAYKKAVTPMEPIEQLILEFGLE